MIYNIVVNKLQHRIGAQKLSLSILLSANAWKRTGRWKSIGSEVCIKIDRNIITRQATKRFNQLSVIN